MTRKRFASIWDAIEDSAADAASMKLRAELANEIIERLHAKKLTQAKAAELIGVTQPRVSDLMRGRLKLVSLDALVDIADRVGPAHSHRRESEASGVMVPMPTASSGRVPVDEGRGNSAQCSAELPVHQIKR